MSSAELAQSFAQFDTDSDGLMSRDEFIQWLVQNRRQRPMDKKQLAVEMFAIFDKDNSGSIQVSELVEGLKGLKHGLTTDDIVALAHELDVNGDGDISLEEFEAIIL